MFIPGYQETRKTRCATSGAWFGEAISGLVLCYQVSKVKAVRDRVASGVREYDSRRPYARVRNRNTARDVEQKIPSLFFIAFASVDHPIVTETRFELVKAMSARLRYRDRKLTYLEYVCLPMYW